MGLGTICLTILFWNNVCSQLLYQNNNQLDNGLIRDSKEASTQQLQERLEALLKETKLESELWRGKHETLTDFHNKLPTICKKYVQNVSKVMDICRDDPSLVFPHHDECQLYYNCSLTYADVPAHLEQHMVECPYPRLFSTKSLRCENFTDVCCGTRRELKDKCDYRLHSERISRCNWEYPSCSGKTDGYYESDKGPNSYYNCFNERILSTVTCDNDNLWNIEQMIYKGQCRNPYEVPVKDGGLLSSCDGKKDGNYANEFKSIRYRGNRKYERICDAYYRCQGGISRAIKCPNGTVFESVSRTCKPGNHSIGLRCQLYCNPDFKTFYSFPNNFAECSYPEQFSDVTHRCENFTKVACGSRPQVKDYCKYSFNVRLTKCVTYTPSCAGLPDGFNINPITIGSTNYMICLQERVIAKENCPIDDEWQAHMFPYNGKCTHQYAIPTSWYNVGLLPSCVGRADGHYQYPTRPCGVYYYKCKGWVATAMKCPPNTKFDKTTGKCKAGISCS